jgi:hypothetical protein
MIRDTDYVLLAASADENIPTIEVYVYDEENGALYVHHDLMVSLTNLKKVTQFLLYSNTVFRYPTHLYALSG